MSDVEIRQLYTASYRRLLAQLIGAALMFGYATYVSTAGMNESWTASVVSLSGGALLANLVSVVLLVVETVTFHRG